MSDKNQSVGLGFYGALQILFIGLKLGKVIDWSWVWVMSPILIPLAIMVILSILIVVFSGGKK